VTGDDAAGVRWWRVAGLADVLAAAAADTSATWVHGLGLRWDVTEIVGGVSETWERGSTAPATLPLPIRYAHTSSWTRGVTPGRTVGRILAVCDAPDGLHLAGLIELAGSGAELRAREAAAAAARGGCCWSVETRIAWATGPRGSGWSGRGRIRAATMVAAAITRRPLLGGTNVHANRGPVASIFGLTDEDLDEAVERLRSRHEA